MVRDSLLLDIVPLDTPLDNLGLDIAPLCDHCSSTLAGGHVPDDAYVNFVADLPEPLSIMDLVLPTYADDLLVDLALEGA